MSAESLVAHVRDCSTCRHAFSSFSMCGTGQYLQMQPYASVRTSESYAAKIDSGLRSNLLVVLQLIIERDPSIPSPGELTMIANRAVCQRDLEAERLA